MCLLLSWPRRHVCRPIIQLQHYCRAASMYARFRVEYNYTTLRRCLFSPFSVFCFAGFFVAASPYLVRLSSTYTQCVCVWAAVHRHTNIDSKHNRTTYTRFYVCFSFNAFAARMVATSMSTYKKCTVCEQYCAHRNRQPNNSSSHDQFHLRANDSDGNSLTGCHARTGHRRLSFRHCQFGGGEAGERETTTVRNTLSQAFLD